MHTNRPCGTLQRSSEIQSLFKRAEVIGTEVEVSSFVDAVGGRKKKDLSACQPQDKVNKSYFG